MGAFVSLVPSAYALALLALRRDTFDVKQRPRVVLLTVLTAGVSAVVFLLGSAAVLSPEVVGVVLLSGAALTTMPVLAVLIRRR